MPASRGIDNAPVGFRSLVIGEPARDFRRAGKVAPSDILALEGNLDRIVYPLYFSGSPIQSKQAKLRVQAVQYPIHDQRIDFHVGSVGGGGFTRSIDPRHLKTLDIIGINLIKSGELDVVV